MSAGMDAESRAAKEEVTWRTLRGKTPAVNLFYGSVEIARVFAVDLKRQKADVHILTGVVTGSWVRLDIAKIAGRVGTNNVVDESAVVVELSRRAGIVFPRSQPQPTLPTEGIA